MNCKQIDELLPLYASHDLDEKRARLVSKHVQMCVTCARVAEEYRETVELTQRFVPPVFADNVYASVREQVLRQIEDEPTAPLPQLFTVWFRPRMAWAIASVLLITFGFFALYSVVNWNTKVQPVANNHPVAEQPGSSAPGPKVNVAGSGTGGTPTEDKRKVNRRIVNRPLKAKDSWSRSASISPKWRDPEPGNTSPAYGAAPGQSPLRVELQTKNPNIRIIWFTQSNTKPALPSSKGI